MCDGSAWYAISTRPSVESHIEPREQVVSSADAEAESRSSSGITSICRLRTQTRSRDRLLLLPCHSLQVQGSTRGGVGNENCLARHTRCQLIVEGRMAGEKKRRRSPAAARAAAAGRGPRPRSRRILRETVMSKSANMSVVARFRPANEREKLLASSGAYAGAGSEYLSFGEGSNLSAPRRSLRLGAAKDQQRRRLRASTFDVLSGSSASSSPSHLRRCLYVGVVVTISRALESV